MKRPKLPATIGSFLLDHFYNTNKPTFAVYEAEGAKNQLVCVCVYRCGAEEVIKRLNDKGE